MNRTIATATAALAALLLAPDRAAACGPMYNLAPFEPAQALRADADVVAPATPVVASARVEGKEEGESGGCVDGESGCGGPSVVVELEPPVDEPAGQIGWRFRVVKGEAPREGFVPEEPVVPEGGGTLFSFGYPGEGAFDVTLAVTAIDAAGNESEAATVRIRDEGEGTGCSAGGAGRSLPWLVLVGLLVRRRR